MNILRQFKNPKLVSAELDEIKYISPDHSVNLMEVCGTHTMQIARYGLRKQMPSNVNLISGPGCPVCVTPVSFIDKALYILRNHDVVMATFGDLFRVNGTDGSLEKEKANGKIIEVIYSPDELKQILERYKNKPVVFLSIGFETTMPAIALTIKAIKSKNFFVLCGNKLFMPALKALIKIISNTSSSKIDGLILPGHLSIIAGEDGYSWLNIPGVITGFEPFDIVSGIHALLKMISQNRPSVQNGYKRIVTKKGNINAVRIIQEVFRPCDSEWRGLGLIPGSGAALQKEYESFDAEKKFKIPAIKSREHKSCRCAEVLMGIINPGQCPMMAKQCAPENPLGACMASSEGSCAAWYYYER